MQLILGSASPSRQRLMQSFGYQFEIMAANIDEKKIRHHDPYQLVTDIALAKAEALLSKIKPPALLITTDQVMVCDGEIQEKPLNISQARAYLQGYSNNTATSYCAVVVTDVSSRKQEIQVDIVDIRFKSIPQELIERLLKDPVTLCVAGGLCAGKDEPIHPYVAEIKGDIDSLQGLSGDTVATLLNRFDF